MFASAAPTRDQLRSATFGLVAFVVASFAMPGPPAADDTVEVSGTLTANGTEVVLPYVYIWREKQGFYDPSDPTWKILFVERELPQREIDEPVWDAAWVEIGITETSEFSDKPELQVYSQSIKFSADAAGNLSGGTYPQIELQGLGTDRISGRIYHTETQEFFDDTYRYDFTFKAPLSDPDAPIGDPLPAGGGEPGLAYLKWVETIHSGDIAVLRTIVPPDLAEQLDSASEAEVKEQIEFLQLMTPTDVQIMKGFVDGEIAVLEIEGMMEGQKVSGEIEMTKMGKFWIPTKSSM